MQLFSVFLRLYSTNVMSIGIKRGISLEELAQRSMQHDKIAQRLLYESLSGKMLVVCRRYVGCRETARDVMHDGFIKLFEKLGSYSGLGSFEGWARKMFINTALTYLRKSNVLRFSEPIDNSYSALSLQNQELNRFSADDLLAYIGLMPPGFRTVFNLFAIEGYSHEEIAKMLGISEGTSRSQYIRARRWLQQKIKDEL